MCETHGCARHLWWIMGGIEWDVWHVWLWLVHSLCGSSVLAEEAQGTEKIFGLSFLLLSYYTLLQGWCDNASFSTSPAMAPSVAAAIVRQGWLCNIGNSFTWLEIHMQHLSSCDLAALLYNVDDGPSFHCQHHPSPLPPLPLHLCWIAVVHDDGGGWLLLTVAMVAPTLLLPNAWWQWRRHQKKLLEAVNIPSFHCQRHLSPSGGSKRSGRGAPAPHGHLHQLIRVLCLFGSNPKFVWCQCFWLLCASALPEVAFAAATPLHGSTSRAPKVRSDWWMLFLWLLFILHCFILTFISAL